MAVLFDENEFVFDVAQQKYLPRVSEDTLNKFCDNTFHWKALTPRQSRAMAIELRKYRSLRPNNPCDAFKQ